MFNIFVIIIFASAVGILLAVYMTRNPPPGAMNVIPEDDYKRDNPELRKLKIEDLRNFTQTLFDEHSLTLKEKVTESPFEEYWIAESDSQLFSGTYVFGMKETTPDAPFVSLQDILQFKDFIKGIEKNKGFFMTTGFFVREVHQPLEGVPVTLYNKTQVLDELARRESTRLDQKD